MKFKIKLTCQISQKAHLRHPTRDAAKSSIVKRLLSALPTLSKAFASAIEIWKAAQAIFK
jgi:hypothetical protein